ncbi:hypothetical protein J2Y48_004771 [Mycoplana sp. BE70]|nr:hypothetical protein [Mycoplana sp. BE70]
MFYSVRRTRNIGHTAAQPSPAIISRRASCMRPLQYEAYPVNYSTSRVPAVFTFAKAVTRASVVQAARLA